MEEKKPRGQVRHWKELCEAKDIAVTGAENFATVIVWQDGCRGKRKIVGVIVMIIWRLLPVALRFKVFGCICYLFSSCTDMISQDGWRDRSSYCHLICLIAVNPLEMY